ncbi:MAG: type I restriction enzyme HsdR N-terminal domain-containing protein [Paludibacteraceae bacterium]|nr:type I restriction enzyme HsdR N-terminal domain-containing protein [Paludibacteraceae bacterium]
MRTRINQNKEQIFCEWRHKWVRLTPEEWVRQQLLHRLVEQLGYPTSLIAVEVAFQLPSLQGGDGGRRLRADAVVYNADLQPLMLIECKAETVPLTQKTLDQALIYNRRLEVPFLLLHNGPQSIVAAITPTGCEFSTVIPSFNQLLG